MSAGSPDMRSAPVTLLIYIAGSGLGGVFALVQTALYGHFLPPAQFGALSTLLTIQLFLAGVTTFGLDAAVSRMYFDYIRSPQSVRTFLSSVALAWVVVAAATGTLAVVVLYRTVGSVFLVARDVRPAIPYLALGSLGLGLVAILQALQIARRKSFRYVCTSNGMKAAILMATLVALRVSATAGAQVVAQCAAIALVLAIVTAVWGHEFIGRADARLSLGSLALGTPMALYAAANSLFGVADRTILEHYHGLVMVGLYGMAQALTQPLSAVLLASARVWAPSFTATETSGASARRQFEFAGTAFIGIGGALAAGFSLLAPEFLTLMGKQAYVNAVDPFRILLVGYVAFATYYLDYPILLLYKRTWLLAALVIGAGCLNVLGDLVLIPRWGAAGCALASMLTLLVLAGTMRLAASRLYPGKADAGRMARLAAVSILGTGLPLTWVLPLWGRLLAVVVVLSIIGAEMSFSLRRSGLGDGLVFRVRTAAFNFLAG
jgi:O-antigen/teichoic acid export membrane protein